MYTVHQAKTNLSKLLRKVENGEEVVIARGKEPVAKIIPFPARRKKRVPGSLKGKIWYAPDAFDPLTKEELVEWGIE
ncbi:MAG TPA: type II toxin-antitoxin system prevent-host-death family antitoxin [Candidatus Acidoferrum sp.]|nr:type II toxin-antitoxin system prevent-host-death family antitoxin [Candidatus Acidoferrum sp.]